MTTRLSVTTRAILCALVLTTLLPRPMFAVPEPAFARVKFGNVSFDPTGFADVVDQGQTMLLVSTNPKFRDSVRVVVGPAVPGTGKLVMNDVWARASAGQTLKKPFNESGGPMLNGGGDELRRYGEYQTGGCTDVFLAIVGQKVTPFVFSGKSSLECMLGGLIINQIIMTIRGEADSGNSNGGPTATTTGVGSPSDLGDDPYDSIDWDGPDDWAYGVYDIHEVNVKRELKEIAALSPDFIGAVTPKVMTFEQAIGNIRSLVDSPLTRDRYAQFKELARGDPSTVPGAAFVSVVSGDPLMLVLEMFSAYEVHPDDPNNWLNLAAVCSHVRLANESTAILKEMVRRGKKPDPPIISSDAAVEYLTGYNQLLFGQSLTAKGHLHQAMTLDPFMKEAAILLAFAQKMTGEEEAAEATYIQGVWRRRPSQMLYCGGATSSPDGRDIRPPIPDMLDVSHGSPGVLPNFDHPNNWSEALGLKQRYERTLSQIADESRGLAQTANSVHNRIEGHPKDSTQKWHEYLETLMLTLHDEIAVKKLMDAQNKADQEMQDAIKRIGKRTGPMLMSIMMKPGDHHDELAAVATDNVAALRPFAQAYDRATRRLFKTVHRFQTGLAAQMGDPDWHQLALIHIKMEANTSFVNLAGTLIGSYTLVAAIVPPPQVPPSLLSMNPEDVALCANGVRNLGFKFSIKVPDTPLEFGIKAQCDKMSVEVGFYPYKFGYKDIAELKAGAFAQADFSGKGDVTVFVGVAGKGSVGSAGAGVKGGVYVSTNLGTGQVKDIGIKATADSTLKFGENLQATMKGGELKESFLPSIPQATRGPDLRTMNPGGPSLPR